MKKPIPKVTDYLLKKEKTGVPKYKTAATKARKKFVALLESGAEPLVIGRNGFCKNVKPWDNDYISPSEMLNVAELLSQEFAEAGWRITVNAWSLALSPAVVPNDETNKDYEE